MLKVLQDTSYCLIVLWFRLAAKRLVPSTVPLFSFLPAKILGDIDKFADCVLILLLDAGKGLLSFGIDKLNLLYRLANHLGGQHGLDEAGTYAAGTAYDTDLLALDFFRQFLLVRFYVWSEHADRTEGHAVRDEFIEVEHNI